MFYNLKLFGKKFKNIRKNLGLTQKEVSKLTHLDVITIRRIETGKVLPKLDTLESLSSIYKEDLISLLLEYRLDDYSSFCDIKNKVESKLHNLTLYNLKSEFDGLILLLESTTNPYYKDIIQQFIMFIESAILYKDNNNEEALNKLLESIKITTPTFSLDNYSLFIYSSMEIRILMNIALVFDRLNNKEKYLEITKFCLNSVETGDEIYSKLSHNLAGAYAAKKDFESALKFSNLGIKSSQENRNFSDLSYLYYGKGIAEFMLNKDEHLESLKTSIYLCKAFGQDQFEITIKHNCKEFLGINL